MNEENHRHAKDEIRATVDHRALLRGCAMTLGLCLLLAVGLTPRNAQAPENPPSAAQVQSDPTQTLAADCQLIQKLTFTPCGHELTRRQTLPPELAGQTRQAIENAYDAWTITSFSSEEVRMAQALSLYCPEHVVLMPDESGNLCIFRNRYGDALALVKELGVPLTELPDEYQEELRLGKGFENEEALAQWLENAES